MAFVPHVPRQTASPEAQDLANRITALIQDYQRSHPDLSERDVRDALNAAAEPGATGRRPAVVATLAAVIAAVGVLGFVMQRSSGAVAWETGLVALVVAVLAIVATARRRS